MRKVHIIVCVVLTLAVSIVVGAWYYYRFIRPQNGVTPVTDTGNPSAEEEFIFVQGISADSGKQAYSLYDGVALLDNNRLTLTQEEKDSGIAVHTVRTLAKDELAGTVTGENPAIDTLGLGETYMIDNRYIIGKDKVRFTLSEKQFN